MALRPNPRRAGDKSSPVQGGQTVVNRRRRVRQVGGGIRLIRKLRIDDGREASTESGLIVLAVQVAIAAIPHHLRYRF